MMDFTLNRALSKKVVRDSRFWDDDNIRYVISFVGLLIQQGAYGGLNHPLLNFTKHPSKVCTLSGFSQKNLFSLFGTV